VTNYQRHCPNCNYDIQDVAGSTSCRKCGINYKVFDGNILIPETIDENSPLLNRTINIAKGEVSGPDSSAILRQSFKRFNTETSTVSPLRESPVKLIFAESLYMAQSSFVAILLLVLFFGGLLYGLNYIDLNILGGNTAIADFFGINLVFNWVDPGNYVLTSLPIFFIPLFNIIEWLNVIVLTIGLSLAVLIFEKSIFETNTSKISYTHQIKKFTKILPKILSLGIFLAFIYVLLIKSPEFLSTLIADNAPSPPVNQIMQGNFDFFTIASQLVTQAILFPIWLMINILIFLAIPSIMLRDREDIGGIRYGEVLVRGYWIKTLMMIVARIVLFTVILFILIYIEFFIIHQDITPIFEITIIEILLDYETILGPLSGFLILPYAFFTFVILTGTQLIMFLELHRKRVYQLGKNQ
jgi:hypothetical protein